MKKEKASKQRPAQKQSPPGRQNKMKPIPQTHKETYGCRKLEGKTALITGGDSGIGQAVAIAFAKEGADVAIAYLKEHEDAKETQRLVEEQGQKCFLISGDVGDEKFCKSIVDSVISTFGKLDILVNNAAEQHPQDTIEKITEKQLERTFRTNIFAYFFMTKAALKHLIKTKGIVINTTSVTAYRGSAHLLDYSATKGAIVAFTRSLALSLVKKNIRVNGVAPGPIWTPLIPSTFPASKVEKFGSDVPMKRAGEPAEVAPCYVFLASADSSYMTGQILHPNGGEIINT
ncbi:putative oxidoreductase YhdF [Chlamydiales bacterium STE3]|nr:putative oxidoreductase YhdF [Chlamydiales bacterium STE3]